MPTRSLAAVSLVLALAALAAADAPSGPTALRVLGPLPLPPAAGSGLLAPSTELVPEIDATVVDPWVGEEVILNPKGGVRWQETAVAGDGTLRLGQAGVYWLAVRVEVDRWTRLTLRLVGGARAALSVDGEERASRTAAAAAPLEAKAPAARGSHLILARLEVVDPAQEGSVRLEASTEPAAAVLWSVVRAHALARFEETAALVSIDAVAVDLKGERVARRITRRVAGGDIVRSSVEVLDRSGKVLFASVGDESAQPVGFSPDPEANVLLLRQKGKSGSDLVLFDLNTGDLRTVVRDEPDLGLVRWGPGGTHLLLSSSRGVKEDALKPDAPRRRRALREKLPDYDPRVHLHLVEVATGARTRLTAPGDWVLDDAQFVGARRSVVWARTVPRDTRPWFATEIRLLDLVTGGDRLVTTFVAGWETRPHALAPGPRGQQVAFLAPPMQVGQGPEHSLYQSAVWLLDLDTGALSNITSGSPHAFTGGGDLLAWKHNGDWLVATATEGSRTRIARLRRGAPGWQVELLEHQAETVAEAAASGQGLGVAFVASSRNLPPRLQYLDLETGQVSVLEAPNAALAERWNLVAAADCAFTGPGGERIDAWWYPPAGLAPGAKAPLVVYFYGGTEPTLRRFSAEHQVLAGNGYAVLVINPRGAIGYGQAFADHHVGDWGPKAAADILAGVDAFLAAHPEVDAAKVGIYGGSYGGFMVEYLVSVSDRFAAAVSLFGISDLTSYWGAGAWGVTYGDIALAGAYPWTQRDLFVGHSPVFSADRIHTPLLLLHGSSDRNVPPEQSEQLYTALQVLGRSADLVLFPGEDHGISGSWQRRVEHRTMILQWFDRYLRGQPEAWEARWEKGKEKEKG